MKAEIIISGFGGQGVLSMGKILAYSALMEDKEVTWMPAYGPEQRGGTANVTVIISDKRISSPILSKYDIAIVLNQPSLDKFEPKWYHQPAQAHRHQCLHHRCHGQGGGDEKLQDLQHDCAWRTPQGLSRCHHQWLGEGPLQDSSRASPWPYPPQHGGRGSRWRNHREERVIFRRIYIFRAGQSVRPKLLK